MVEILAYDTVDSLRGERREREWLAALVGSILDISYTCTRCLYILPHTQNTANCIITTSLHLERLVVLELETLWNLGLVAVKL